MAVRPSCHLPPYGGRDRYGNRHERMSFETFSFFKISRASYRVEREKI